MINRNVEDPRRTIADNFAKWTVHSALRNPRSPIKDRATVYDALNAVGFALLFDMARGPVGEEYFENWHADAMAVLGDFDPRLGNRLGSKMIASLASDSVPVGKCPH